MTVQLYTSLQSIYQSFNKTSKDDVVKGITLQVTQHKASNVIHHLTLHLDVKSKEEVGERLYSVLEYLKQSNPEIAVVSNHFDPKALMGVGDIHFISSDGKKVPCMRFFMSLQSEEMQEFLKNDKTEFHFDCSYYVLENFVKALHDENWQDVFSLSDVYHLAFRFNIQNLQCKIIGILEKYSCPDVYLRRDLERGTPFAEYVEYQTIKKLTLMPALVKRLHDDWLESLFFKGLKYRKLDFYTAFLLARKKEIGLTEKVIRLLEGCSPPVEQRHLYSIFFPTDENDKRPYLIEYLSHLLNLSIPSEIALSQIVILMEKALNKYPNHRFLNELMGFLWYHQFNNKDKAEECLSLSESKYSKFYRSILKLNNTSDLEKLLRSTPKRFHSQIRGLIAVMSPTQMHIDAFEKVNTYQLAYMRDLLSAKDLLPDEKYYSIKLYVLNELKAYPYFYIFAGRFTLKREKYDEAVRILSLGNQFYPEDKEILSLYLKALVATKAYLPACHISSDQTYELTIEKCPEDAKQVLKCILQLKPDARGYRIELSGQYYKEGKYEKALACIEILKEPPPVALAFIKAQLGRYAECLNHLDQNRCYKNPSINKLRAHCHLQLKNYTEFIAEIKEIYLPRFSGRTDYVTPPAHVIAPFAYENFISKLETNDEWLNRAFETSVKLNKFEEETYLFANLINKDPLMRNYFEATYYLAERSYKKKRFDQVRKHTTELMENSNTPESIKKKVNILLVWIGDKPWTSLPGLYLGVSS